jgi:hypothetical protein
MNRFALRRYMDTILNTYIEISATMKSFDNCRIRRINFTLL